MMVVLLVRFNFPRGGKHFFTNCWSMLMRRSGMTAKSRQIVVRSFAHGRRPTTSTIAVELRLGTESHAKSAKKQEILRSDALLDMGLRLLPLIESLTPWYTGVVHATAKVSPQGDKAFLSHEDTGCRSGPGTRNCSLSITIRRVPCYCT